MNFPRFWQRAQAGKVVTWGWSDTSAEEALAKARERQARVLAWLRGTEKADALGHYGYPNRPMREEVLREFPEAGGKRAAVLTRNSYGCTVLNTTRLVFVDVDTPRGGIGSFFSRLLGRKTLDPQTALEQALADKARAWISAHSSWRWRLYRTAAGARLMAVHGPVPTDDPRVAQAFEHFGADRLYRALCQTQQCFRARLTPKPWRCDADKPPDHWPWGSAETEARFREWDRVYTEKSAPFATCHFLAEFGSAPLAREFEELLQTHDRTTRAHENLPLA